MTDERLFFPATARNRDALADVVRTWRGADGLLLEIASGSGEHAVHIAPQLDGITWLPTDIAPHHRASVNAWRRHSALEELILPAQHLDIFEDKWEIGDHALQLNTILVVNLLQVVPMGSVNALLKGTVRHLTPGGRLIIYGPFMENQRHMSEGNALFHDSLQARGDGSGLKDYTLLTRDAEAKGFETRTVIPMPANNLSLVFEKSRA